MDYRQIPAIFVDDAPGLDFLNSVATPVDEKIDWIRDGEGLLAWLEQAGLVPHAAHVAMRSQSTGHARRWCSMAICGNRAKVAAHRKRLKEQESH